MVGWAELIEFRKQIFPGHKPSDLLEMTGLVGTAGRRTDETSSGQDKSAESMCGVFFRPVLEVDCGLYRS